MEDVHRMLSVNTKEFLVEPVRARLIMMVMGFGVGVRIKLIKLVL
jgi:hypothetical protein